MYNRYIPEDESYTRTEEAPAPPPGPPVPGDRPKPPPLRLPGFLSGKEGLSALLGGREGSGLSALLRSFHLDSVDSGDVLLLLIMLYLLVEGDDLDLVIALGVVLLMGLGEDKE